MAVVVRTLVATDLPACVALVQGFRRQLAQWEPRFWNPSAHAEAMTNAWFGHLVAQENVVALAATEDDALVGFLFAAPIAAPPVYDPGGPAAQIDNFCVVEERWADVGAALLDAARVELRKRGVASIIVIAADQHAEKAAFLRAQNLSLASTWWTAPA